MTVHPETLAPPDSLAPGAGATGAIFRTEFDTVVVQPDVCNGCGYCVPACPFGVVDLNLDDGKAHKCTLCYDRLKGGLATVVGLTLAATVIFAGGERAV